MIKKSVVVFILLAIVVIFGAVPGNAEDKSKNAMKRGSAEYYLNEGVFYLNEGDMKNAEEKFNQALKKDPSMVTAINGLGIVYLQKRDFDKAAHYFRRVIQLNEAYYDAYNYLGVVFSETGQYELAKENFLIAANAEKYRTPENPFSNLALLEINQKKYDSALRYVEKGLACNKNFAPLYNLKGMIIEERGQLQEALSLYQKAQSLLTADDISFLINIGRIYTKLGDKNKALDILEKALSKAFNPDLKAQIKKMISDIETPTGKPQETPKENPTETPATQK